jgi:hypothetical protein
MKIIKKIILFIIKKMPFFNKNLGYLKRIGIIPPPPLPTPNVKGKFVAVWILGGLGNQLFQYATAFSLAKRMDATLLLNSNFENYTLHEEGLSKIGIDDMSWEVQSPSLGYPHNKKKDLYRVVTEKDFSFDSSVYNLNESCYLHGYWASPRYFMDCKDDLRKKLDFNLTKTPDMISIIDEMVRSSSVSVHLRRGNYNTSDGIASFGLIGKDYYDRAANLLLRIDPGCRFYIFSDDIAEAEDIFKSWPNIVIMPIRGACQDMLLMSSCRHHIIGNSTFSWWGAWLGKHQDGITVAPRHWFTKSATIAHKYLLDLFPDDWIQL